MAVKDAFIKELREESVSARAMLERIPGEKFDWKPHEKSFSMGQLATLVADMFGWIAMIVDDPELDFAKGYKQDEPKTTEDLVALLDKKLAAGIASLENAEDARFAEHWILRNGDMVLQDMPKDETLRQTINHMVHHRGQLTVYLRENDIPVPSVYGPTADEGWGG